MSKLAVIKYSLYTHILDAIASITNYLQRKGNRMSLMFIKKALSKIHIYYYPIITSECAVKNGCIRRMIVNSDRTGYYSNLVFNNESKNLTLIPVHLEDIYMDELRDINITGQSQFLYDSVEEVIINDFSLYYNEQLYENTDVVLRRQKGNSALLNTCLSKYDRYEPKGIMISGIFAFNYYHTLFENYIKLLVVEEIDLPLDIPILVDANYQKYDSYRVILKALNCSGRKIIPISYSEIVKVGRLYVISPINQIPPQARDIMNTCPSDIAFDINYLKHLRNRLIVLKSDKNFSKKVFISRKGNSKRSWNEEEVFCYLRTRGFEEYSPQRMSFSEQISLFNGAEFIVASSGAALSNLLFCDKGCKVLCVYSSKVNIPTFTTIAYMNEVYMKYVIGKPIKSSSVSNTHSNFVVDMKLFIDAFSNFASE